MANAEFIAGEEHQSVKDQIYIDPTSGNEIGFFSQARGAVRAKLGNSSDSVRPAGGTVVPGI
jgi:hypothetical protein